MKNMIRLSVKNLRGKPLRTVLMLVLTALLAFTVFGGSVVIISLQNGMDNLEARLGADIIVVPSSEKSQVNLDNLLLNGTTGYYYMDSSYLSKIEEIEGVGETSAQIFFASMKADCCSAALQIIGFDQETDFTIQPWISERYEGTLSDWEIVAGSDVNLTVGESLTVYNRNCPVVAKLSKTGTGLDTAVYCSIDTIRLLLEAAEELGRELKISGDPEDVISAIYIKVDDGYDVGQVTDSINVYVRKVEAVQTKTMLTSVSEGLASLSSAIRFLIAVLWVLAFVILIVAFFLLINERKREFAVLRILGSSQGMLFGMILSEALLVSICGAIAGIGLAAAVIFPFGNLIESSLGLPFLTPDIGTVVLLALGAVAAALLSCFIASGYSAYRLSRVDAGNALREGT